MLPKARIANQNLDRKFAADWPFPARRLDVRCRIGKRYAVREDLRLRLAGWFRHNGQYEGSKLGPIPVWSAGESYAWTPSHDQCGMLRPFGTSSADWW